MVEDVHTLMDDQAQAGSTKERRGSGKALSRSLFSHGFKEWVVFWLTVMDKEVSRGKKLSE